MIPPTLQANPLLSRWVHFDSAGTVLINFGKVEYGQGSSTGLLQIGAEELDVDLARVRWAEPTTLSAPDEGITAGSMTTESSGQAVRHACAQVRALFLEYAAAALSCETRELRVVDGAFLRGDKPTGHDYWSLAGQVNLDIAPKEDVTLKNYDDYKIVGKSIPRVDLAPKIFGAAFVHDLLPEGVIHARVLRQPGSKAQLISLNETAICKAAGEGIDILKDENFIAFLSKDEGKSILALNKSLETTVWENVNSFDPTLTEAVSLKSLPNIETTAGADAAPDSNRKRITATYSKPYWSHGSLGPSCGVAELKGDTLTVWTHSQGVFPLRQLIATVTGHPIEKVEVIHGQGPGNYGHNGADDAAVDAAVIAVRRPGAPIRVQWRREDDFGYAPTGSAMMMELTAELDASGQIADLNNEIWSGPYMGRGNALAPAALAVRNGEASDAAPMRPAGPWAGRGRYGLAISGSSLNATPDYDIEAMRVIEHIVQTPVRTSSLRGLGGPANEYAVECFIDECADAAEADPVTYRLAMLTDLRGVCVLERCAEMAGWHEKRGAPGTGQGIGVSYSLHRNRAGHIAVIAEVDVEQDVRVRRVWCVADSGLIVNPDGAKNQLEGGIIMGASWALKEQVKLDENGVTSVTWDDYPILRFDEVPEITIELIDQPHEPSVGTGESSSGPVMAAIGNAVAHALGTRLRDLPLTRERIAAALLADSA